MRELAGISLLLLLGTGACSSYGGSDGSRSGTGGVGAGAGANTAGSSGAPVLPGGGSGGSNAAGTASGGAGAGAPPVSGGAPGQAGAPPVNTDTNAHVITWVPPYHINEAKQQLNANFGGASMADGLSFLALQFWLTDGPNARLQQASEADVTWFHDWARQHNVKIFLCVHNNTGDWNWPEAQRSFRDNRDAFVQSLVSQVMARDFDGVDLDLEGIVAATDEDQSGYRALVQALVSALHPVGKFVTMDSFHGPWNEPNWSWWPDLLPLVDGITSMGYEQSGMDVDYQTLVDHAAAAPEKLQIGVPSYKGTWLNHTVTEQLGWLVQQGHVGTGIWDASLTATEWRQGSVWQQLKAIKSR